MKKGAKIRKNVKWTGSPQNQIQKWLDQWQVHERWSMPLNAIHVRMMAIHGAKHAGAESRKYAAAVVWHELCLGAGAVLLALFTGMEMLAAGFALMVLYIFYSYKSLDNQVKRRRQQIILELPELLNKLTLLINAGETIHLGIHRCAASFDGDEHPLRREWAVLSRSLRDNKPFVLAMEEFSRSCSVLEVSMFTTAVLTNFRRGGSDFVASLEELSHTLWERRKATAKIIGEEASSKLIFPMVLLFCTVMMIVAAPAVLMMN